MSEVTNDQLQAMIEQAVTKVLSKKDLSEKGEYQDGDKIIFTSAKLKERLDRAKSAAIKELLSSVGVDDVETLKQKINTTPADTPNDDFDVVLKEIEADLKQAKVSEDKIPLLKGLFVTWAAEQEKDEDISMDNFLKVAKEKYSIDVVPTVDTKGAPKIDEAKKPQENIIDVRDPKIPMEQVEAMLQKLI